MQVRACKEPAAWLGKRASGATGEGDDRHREQRHEQPWSLKPHLRTPDQTSKSCRKIGLQYGVVEAADIASARLRPARQVSGISSPAPGNAKIRRVQLQAPAGDLVTPPRDLPTLQALHNPPRLGGDLRALQARESTGRRNPPVPIVIREAPRLSITG